MWEPRHARAIEFFVAAFTHRYVLRTKAHTVLYFPRLSGIKIGGRAIEGLLRKLVRRNICRNALE